MGDPGHRSRVDAALNTTVLDEACEWASGAIA